MLYYLYHNNTNYQSNQGVHFIHQRVVGDKTFAHINTGVYNL